MHVGYRVYLKLAMGLQVQEAFFIVASLFLLAPGGAQCDVMLWNYNSYCIIY